MSYQIVGLHVHNNVPQSQTSLTQSIIFNLIFAQISIHKNILDSSGQKQETMAKQYTLIWAHEKNFL